MFHFVKTAGLMPETVSAHCVGGKTLPLGLCIDASGRPPWPLTSGVRVVPAAEGDEGQASAPGPGAPLLAPRC